MTQQVSPDFAGSATIAERESDVIVFDANNQDNSKIGSYVMTSNGIALIT